MPKRILCILALSLCGLGAVSAQGLQKVLDRGTLTGNIQVDAQYYRPDSLIGAQDVPQKVLSNSFANLLYTNGKFTIGARLEAYYDPMLGYDSRYKGIGVPYRFVRYSGDIIDVTAGNFYEQFGSGMIFRTYQDWNLGLDNSLDGFRAIVTPTKGITIKGVIGSERLFWGHDGLIRGLDAEFAFNEFIKPMQDAPVRLTIGGSFVSKYEKAEDVTVTLPDNSLATLNLPLNVGSFAGRLNLETDLGLSFGGEYVWKDNDPSAENNYIYQRGQALLLNLGYSMRGFGVLLSAKSVDNMGFRTSRAAVGNFQMINYMPALSRQHAYSLPSFYPYACQPLGEVGFQADIFYKVKKGTVLGGKYGMDIKLNYSFAGALDKQAIDENTAVSEKGTLGYTSKLFALKTGSPEDIYYSDLNIELSRRFGKKVKASIMYMNLIYNQAVVEGHPGSPMLYANVGVVDFTYMFNSKHALRLEYQYMGTKQDEGDWMMATLEYTISPAWFFSVSDMINHGNSDGAMHYYSVSAGWVKGPTRIALSYGRQREGIVCAGGVCRLLPASNGLMLSITSSF